MYTGIIEAQGRLEQITPKGSGLTIKVSTPVEFNLNARVKIGDSIATNGVCLTATKLFDNAFLADVSAETLSLTCYKFYKVGQLLNLELPCTPNTHLGGHIVQGHVDGIGEVVALEDVGEATNVWIQAPANIAKYIAFKGSICVNGASLTVNNVEHNKFRLTLIPHTKEVLQVGSTMSVGMYVNLEVDVLARYLERLLSFNEQEPKSKLSIDMLKENGFI